MAKLHINKHVVIVIVCIILVFVAGIYANKAWNSKVVRDRWAAAQQAAIDADRKRRQTNEVNAEKARLKAECDKEVSYYNALTVTQKKTQTAPACQPLLKD